MQTNTNQHKYTHTSLCFKHAQPKMYHSPKVDDRVDIKKILENLFQTFLKNFKLPSHLNRVFDLNPTLRTRPDYQLSADIHSYKAGTKLPDKSTLYLVWLRFFFYQPFLVMHSRGEPLSTTLKVVPAFFFFIER